jgi:hypothetical protein
MIVPFAITSWILSLALVTGLCRAARRGDLQPRSEPLAEPAGDPIELFVVVGDVAMKSGGPASSNTAREPAVHAGDGNVRPEDSARRRSQMPADLALQPG